MHLLDERGRSYFANSKRLGNNRVNEGESGAKSVEAVSCGLAAARSRVRW
jgi:hypothetical protein